METGKKAEDFLGRGKILLEAHDIINGERQDQYGDPEDSFQVIAEYWSTYIERVWEKQKCLLPLDVANLQILFKQGRKLGQYSAVDNYRDSAGYEGIGADMVEENND